jgi:adenine phosphoribosyltransferase
VPKSDATRIKGLIRTVPDFPKKGIMFRDVTTLIADPWGLGACARHLSEKARSYRPTKVVAVESRGFIFGSLVAQSLDIGLVLARKKGKLPAETVSLTYDLEYGQDTLEIHKDALSKADRVIVIDDLLATGGTAQATAKLVELMGASVAGCLFVVNLPELNGVKKLAPYKAEWIVEFEGH